MNSYHWGPKLALLAMGTLLWACGGAEGMEEAEEFENATSPMIARSNLGPALAFYDAPSGRSDAGFVFFKGHNNDYVWSAKGYYTWPVAEIVTDNKSPESFAFTAKEPAAMAYTLPAITSGAALRVASHHVYLAFRGHNNNSVWHTRREIHEAYASQYLGDWQTPRTIPGAQSNYGPAVAFHDWYESPSNKMFTVAWTALDGTIKLKRATERTFPVDHSWPFSYDDVTGLPSGYKSSDGPAMLSAGTDLHLFFRGQGTNERLYHASGPGSDWSIASIPNAYSKHAPSVTLWNGDILMAYSGHNNSNIWIRRFDTSAGTWQNLGYVEGLATDERPALVATASTNLLLAFRSTSSNDTCVGTFYVDESAAPESAAHTWYQKSGSSCTE